MYNLILFVCLNSQWDCEVHKKTYPTQDECLVAQARVETLTPPKNTYYLTHCVAVENPPRAVL